MKGQEWKGGAVAREGAKHPHPILLTTITGLPVVFFCPPTYFFCGCKVTGCARASVVSGGLASRSFVAPQATHSIHCLSASMTRWILSICPHSGQVAPAINWRFIENPLSLELRVTSNEFRKPGDAGFFISKLAPRHSLLNSTGTKDSLERFCALCGKNQPLIPQWRSRGSTLGSRPRKALNSSMGSRLPPLARISLRKARPVSSLNSPSSSKRE